MIISFKKILLTLLPIICFSSAFADKPLVEDILQSGALPTGSATLAAIGNKNGESVSQSDLQGNSFWSDDAKINWDPSNNLSDTVGNPWLKFAPAIPVHRKGQEGYSSFYDTTITVASTEDYKKITGLYGYKITINLTNDLNFGGETLPPLFNIVAFIGNYHTISDFSIIHASDYSGLLSTVSDSVCDLTLEINSFETTGPYSYLGVLVGRLFSGGKIKNCHVINNTTAGVVRVWGTSYLGGLVGYSEGTIDSCSVSRINVNAGDSCAGGLVGYTKGKISNCSVDTVTVTAQKTCVGGLVGLIEGVSDVKNCRVKNATVSGNTMVGGLIGYNDDQGSTTIIGNITDCTVETVTVTAPGGSGGGLVGYMKKTKNFTNDTVKNATVTGNSYLGGLIGRVVAGTGTIKSCLVETPTVSGTANYVGGLVGELGDFKEVSNCTVKTPTVTGLHNLGGLIGSATTNTAQGKISECLVETPTVSSFSKDYVGGLIGNLVGFKEVSKCTVKTPTIKGNLYLGGLIGKATTNAIGGKIDSCSVENATIQGVDATLGSYMGGLIGFITGNGDITDSKVETVTVKGILNIGGLIGYVETGSGSISSCSVGHATVQGVSSGNGTNMGGLIGLIGGNRAISECKVMDGSVTGTNILGGLIGSNAGATTISKCCVGNVPVTATSDRVGGLIGINNGRVTDCSVSHTEINTLTYLGGIVGENNAGAIVNRCLIVDASIKSENKNPALGKIGGIVGNNAGTVSRCVAMINYFDIKAKYTKGGDLFGRIVANTNVGTLTENHGWVETTIRYYHYRFGIFWGTDYYNSTGGSIKVGRNGYNLFTGDVVGTNAPLKAKDLAIWEYLGFNVANGWNTTDVGTKFYPKLTFMQSYDLGTIGTARGFEYEYNQVRNCSGSYNASNSPSGVKIFTPQFFSIQGINAFYVDISGVDCDLYTDIELGTENGNGNSVFWSTDLSITGTGNFAYSAIRYVDGSPAVTFNGRGHSIYGYYRDIVVNPEYYGGFFYARSVPLTIKRLEIEEPYFNLDGYALDYYIRFGFLISRTYTNDKKITLEDIYVREPYIRAKSYYKYDGFTIDRDLSGYVGAMIGYAGYVDGTRLAVYVSSNRGFKECIYTHVGGVIGQMRNNLNLANIAVCFENSFESVQTYSSFRSYVPGSATSSGETETKSRHMSCGYIVGVQPAGGEGFFSNMSYYSLADYNGGDGHFAGLEGWELTATEPLPCIAYLEPNGEPNAGSFYNTLVNSYIKLFGSSNWIIPENANSYDVILKRDEYTGNYQ